MASFISPSKPADFVDFDVCDEHFASSSSDESLTLLSQDYKEGFLNIGKRSSMLSYEPDDHDYDDNWDEQLAEISIIKNIGNEILELYKQNVIKMEIAFMAQQNQAIALGIEDFNDIGNDGKVIDLKTCIFPDSSNANMRMSQSQKKGIFSK